MRAERIAQRRVKVGGGDNLRALVGSQAPDVEDAVDVELVVDVAARDGVDAHVLAVCLVVLLGRLGRGVVKSRRESDPMRVALERTPGGCVAGWT